MMMVLVSKQLEVTT